MKDVRSILQMISDGHGNKSIATALGCSKNTVKEYRRAIEARKADCVSLLAKEDAELEQFFRSPQPEDCERRKALGAVFSGIEDELKKTGVTLYLLWSEYRMSEKDGYSYPQFCRLYQEYSGKVEVCMHMEHDKADKLYLDFTGKKIPYTERDTGEVREAEVFIATLGYSEYTYVEATRSQDKEHFAECVANALEYFCGVPAVLVPDNLKSAVIKADRYEAELNALLAKEAAHYGCDVLPARSRKPRDKALVERHVLIAYQQIMAQMRHMDFFSIPDINKAIRPLMDAMNARCFKNKPFSRKDLFEEERPLLKPLPGHRFETMKDKMVTVMKNYHVQLSDDSHYYSVPFKYVGVKMHMTYNSYEVRIYFKGQQIACHARDYAKFKYTTVREHMPPAHQYVGGWGPDFFIEEGRKVSPEVELYMRALLSRKDYPEHTYKACMGVLACGKRLGNDRLVKACRLGIRINVFNYTFIKNTLSNKTEGLADSAEEIEQELPEHENIRGAEHYKQQLTNHQSNEPDDIEPIE